MQRPEDELRARVLREVARKPSATRQARRRLAWILAGVAVAMLAGMLAVMGVAESALTRPTAYVAVAVGGAMLLALVATVSLGAGASATGEAQRVLRRVAILTPVGLGLGALAANAVAPTTWGWPSRNLSDHAACLWMDLFLSMMLLGLSCVWLRSSDPWSPKARGAAAGAASGGWIMLLMAVRCPQTDPIHVLATHAIPVVVTVFVGAWGGGRYIAPGRVS